MDLVDYDDLIEFLDIEDLDGVTLSVGYTNAEGEYNEFEITDVEISSHYGDRYIDAYCINKDGEYEGIQRTFKIERFDDIEVIGYDDDDDDDDEY